MLVLAEFEFDLGSFSHIIFETLLPELGENYQRSKAALRMEDNLLVLNVEANDLVSMRAALNGWLRLIKISHEICSVTSNAREGV